MRWFKKHPEALDAEWLVEKLRCAYNVHGLGPSDDANEWDVRIRLSKLGVLVVEMMAPAGKNIRPTEMHLTPYNAYCVISCLIEIPSGTSKNDVIYTAKIL